MHAYSKCAVLACAIHRSTAGVRGLTMPSSASVRTSRTLPGRKAHENRSHAPFLAPDDPAALPGPRTAFQTLTAIFCRSRVRVPQARCVRVPPALLRTAYPVWSAGYARPVCVRARFPAASACCCFPPFSYASVRRCGSTPARSAHHTRRRASGRRSALSKCLGKWWRRAHVPGRTSSSPRREQSLNWEFCIVERGADPTPGDH